MTYAVTFTHARHRTKFETLVTSSTMEAARAKAEKILEQHVGAKAGQLSGWFYAGTEEVSEERQR